MKRREDQDELDAMLALVLAMGGEKDPISFLEKQGQRQAVNSTMVARRMNPAREVWEGLGFSFTDIDGDTVLCQATLPEGWSLRPTDHSMWNDIVDGNGIIRGQMFYKAAFYDRDAHMYLSPRYGVRTDYLEEEGTACEIYFGNNQEKLFVAGQARHPRKASEAEMRAYFDKQEKLVAIAKQWGEENYPDYENVLAYWDKKSTLELKPKKGNK